MSTHRLDTVTPSTSAESLAAFRAAVQALSEAVGLAGDEAIASAVGRLELGDSLAFPVPIPVHLRSFTRRLELVGHPMEVFATMPPLPRGLTLLWSHEPTDGTEPGSTAVGRVEWVRDVGTLGRWVWGSDAYGEAPCGEVPVPECGEEPVPRSLR